MDGLTEHIWVTYLEMISPPDQALCFPDGFSLAREVMDYEPYMSLYRAVGEPLGWDTRFRLSAQDLTALLMSAASANYVLRRDDSPVGFCEFERQRAGEVELKHFGLIPACYGKGLGLRLLLDALTSEWAAHPKRIWLHTDECDHPAAIHTYQKAGFTIFDRRLEDPERL
jgi:ribosomal protein S18 acetylase RimI-like enzyme